MTDKKKEGPIFCPHGRYPDVDTIDVPHGNTVHKVAGAYRCPPECSRVDSGNFPDEFERRARNIAEWMREVGVDEYEVTISRDRYRGVSIRINSMTFGHW